LSVNFWDAQSYSVMLLLSEEDITTGVIESSLLKKLEVAFFDTLQPAFGHMNTEEDVSSFEGIRDGSEFLPVMNSYLCNELYEQLSMLETDEIRTSDFSIIPLGNNGKLFCSEKQQNMNFYDLIRNIVCK